MSSYPSNRVAFLVAGDGIEDIELTSPWAAVAEAGLEPVLVSPAAGKVQTYNGYEKAHTYPVGVSVTSASESDFSALVLPGGVGNPDELRLDDDAVALVRRFIDAGKPVAAICHAAWVLVEAGVVKGRRVTSWRSVRTDLVNAGADWVDEPVVVDVQGAGPLITSRNPGDLEHFNRAITERV